MTNGLNEQKIQWLTYLVYFLLAVLTFITAWNKWETSKNAQAILDMPKEYVRLERYKCDIADIRILLGRMDGKLDRIAEK